MKTKLGLKNFRIFDDKGVEICINPMTILTGCNSSGKSSIVKALILLNEFLKGVRERSTGPEPRLDFSKNPLTLLGNFESILNKDANNDDSITISYTIDSLSLGDGIIVELSFCTQDKDIRKDGFLKDVSVKNADGSLIYHGTGFFSGINRFFTGNKYPTDSAPIIPMKTRFFVYHLVSNVLDEYRSIETDHAVTGNTTEKEVHDVKQNVISILQGLTKNTEPDLVLNAIDFYSKSHWTDGFRTNREIVNRAMQSDIITFLPILDVLDSIPKNDFEVKFRALCMIEGKNPDEREEMYRKGLVDSIVADFICGDYITFSDYYRSLENAFLKKGCMEVRTKGSTGMLLAIPDDEVYNATLGRGIPILGSVDDEVGIVNHSICEDNVDDNFDFRGRVSLEQVFYLLTSINDRPRDDEYVVRIKDEITFIESRDHKILRDYMTFRRNALKDVFTIDICNSLRYVRSNRIEIKRLYSIDNQDNFSHTLTEYFEAIRLKNIYSKRTPGSFINKWIKNFGIGQRFCIESISDGIGLVLKIYRSEDDLDGRILADYGYGVSQLVSILLEIETAILNVKQEDLFSNIVDYEKKTVNLSKLRLVDNLCFTPVSIAIEEPEIHLHPRYQSLLADMFVDAFLNYGIHFIIETHSEYIIRKLQNHVGKGVIKPDDMSILYVENGPASNGKVRKIGIANDGRLTSSFGSGFFDEADSLAMNLLKIKGGLL